MAAPKITTPKKEDGKRVEMGGYWRRESFNKFWSDNEKAISEAGAKADPLKLFGLYMKFLKEQILESRPDLRPGFRDPQTGEYLRTEHELNSTVNTVRPGWNQFCEMWMEKFDPVPASESYPVEPQGPLDVAAHARARGPHKKTREDVTKPLWGDQDGPR